MNEHRVLNMKEVGVYLGIGRDKTYELFKQEDFPSIQLGKTFVILEDDLIEWLKDHRGKRVYL